MLSDDVTRRLAAIVLAALGAALAAWIVRVFRRYPYTPVQFPLYMFGLFMTRVVWRAQIEGRLTLPRSQGAVIVCNHVGPIDPAFIALACDRQVHWMVAREYCHHPLVGWALRILQVIPTGRAGIDTAATKLALRYASQGDLVGMFPEGRINDTKGLMLPGRPGAALIALKARVPVVPCYIHGSPNDGTFIGFLFMTARTRLVVGQPLDISACFDRKNDRTVLEELTRQFMVEIARLAGQPDYVPQLAGRRWKPGLEDEPANGPDDV